MNIHRVIDFGVRAMHSGDIGHSIRVGKWREGIEAKMAGRRVRRNGGKRVKMAGRKVVRNGGPPNRGVHVLFELPSRKSSGTCS